MNTGGVILAIDDEIQIQRFLKIALESHNYRVILASTAKEGLQLAALNKPEVVILDLGLPDQDGRDVLRDIRDWSQVPVIILSVRNDEETIISALDGGADDYITKPFTTGELLARIRVCLRRTQTTDQEAVFRSGELEVDLMAHNVSRRGELVKLTATEYNLLRFLIRHAGKVLTHRQILKEVWDPLSVDQAQYLRVYIAHLRQKLEKDPSHPMLILTEPGIGYRLQVLEEEVDLE